MRPRHLHGILLGATLGLMACGGDDGGTAAGPVDASGDAARDAAAADGSGMADVNARRDGSAPNDSGAQADASALDALVSRDTGGVTDVNTADGMGGLLDGGAQPTSDARPTETPDAAPFADAPADVAVDAPVSDAPVLPDADHDAPVDQAPQPVSLLGTTWIAYLDGFFGAAQAKAVSAFTGTGFEQDYLYWTGSEWKLAMGLRGSLAKVSDTLFTATLTGLALPGAGTAVTWQEAGSVVFEELLEHTWGAAAALNLRLEVHGHELTYARDCDGDQIFDGDYEKGLVWATRFTDMAEDDKHTSAAGTYPYLQYVSLSFHGHTDRMYSYLQVGQTFGGTPTSVVLDVSGPGGVTYAGQAAQYVAEREEWGLAPFVFPAAPTPGLWWISGVEIQMDDGSQARYTAATPYAAYTGTFQTTTGSKGTIAAMPTLVGQDYQTGSGVMYYVETFPNASTTSARLDPGIKIFTEDNPTQWIARQDDGNDLQVRMKIPLISGQKYFILVEDFYASGNAYSLRISDTGFGATSQGTAPLPDSGEPDDDVSQAKELRLNQVVDRSFKRADKDWFYFVAP